jgi:hypothetical protein
MAIHFLNIINHQNIIYFLCKEINHKISLMANTAYKLKFEKEERISRQSSIKENF